MNKKNIVTLILLVVTCAIALAEIPAWPTQNAIPIDANWGFKKVATSTLEINAADDVDLIDYLPYGTIGFEIRSASGSFVIGHPDNVVASSTPASRVGRLIAEGTSYTWTGIAGGTFNGRIKALADNSILVIDAVWGQYERTE